MGKKSLVCVSPNLQDLRSGLRLEQILPAAAWYFTIICVRFFRAPRGKTEHQHK